ncbi:MAG: F0F1 ATP synthase subunit B [Aestuariivita sp.]|nr:F0F1 ATP synthase subunit B [Aestuariivita sp.]MCY4202134.1 F0F1 ATP synthase subunit B [Aestuariivita sp.]
MRGIWAILAFFFMSSPALAAKGPFLSLSNTDFVVLIAFVLFIGVLIYFKVPNLILGMLDKRAETIQDELDAARLVREDAKQVLATLERRQGEVQEQAKKIVEAAQREAAEVLAQGKEDIQSSIIRRLAVVEEQISAAEAAVIRDMKNEAVRIAVSVAREVIAAELTDIETSGRIDSSIAEVEQHLV